MTVANAITFLRIALVPVFVGLMVSTGGSGNAAWGAFIAFTVASWSDFIDGYLARRTKTVTRLGEFLDPLADKLLVGAALVTLVMYRHFPLWAAVLIALREVVVSVLRSVVHRRGNRMPASIQGKIKTSIQIPMVLVWLFRRQGSVAVIQDVTVYLAVALTIVSGITYFLKSRELLRVDEELRT